MSSSFDTTKTRLEDLLRNIINGRIQLPDFQRGWVWDDEHIRSLLVSIARSFPIGAIMLLENGGEARFRVRPIEGVSLSETSAADVEKLILDGQQRLTSLTQVLMLNRPVRTRDTKKKAVKRYYYINIEKALQGPEYYEEAIIGVDEQKVIRKNFNRDIELDLSTPENEYEEFYFPCNQILDTSDWEMGLHTHRDDRFGRYLQFRKQVLEAFRNYHLPVIELRKDNSKEAVCLVFEKVNTGGVPLSVFELMTATYAVDGVNLRDEWRGNKPEGVEGFQPQLKAISLLEDVQPTDFLQGITLLHTYERRHEDIAAGKTGKQIAGVSAKREAVLHLPLSAYQKWKEPLMEGFKRAAKFLRKEAFYSRADLPYRTQLIPLAAVMALLEKNRWLEPRIYDKLARWFWCGVFGELYGGSVETRIALDLQELIRWIDGAEDEPITVQEANFQESRLETLRTRNSAAYKGLHVLIQREGARDFFWKCTIRELEEPEWDEYRIDIHHIFPREWCGKNGYTDTRHIDSILNKTPISYKANRMIGGKAPSEYLSQLQNHQQVQIGNEEMDQILRTHAFDPEFLRSDDFEGFIADRRRRLMKKIGEVMGGDA